MLTVGNVFKTIKFPLIAGGTIYLRHRHLDERVRPSWKADSLLLACSAITFILAFYIIYAKELLW